MVFYPVWIGGLSARRPSATHVRAYTKTLGLRPLSYDTPGMTLTHDRLSGFRPIDLSVPVVDFAKAVAAVRGWAMHNQDWTDLQPTDARVVAGDDVAVLARAAGLWWLTPARVVAVVDEPNRWGFAYGTLEGHVLVGEELFIVERAGTSTRFRIRIISRPADRLASAGSRFIRRYQAKFVEGALAVVERESA